MPTRVMMMFAASAVAVSVGFAVAMQGGEFLHPEIKDHGKVVRLPDAAAQPRDGSRFCVDLTTAGEPEVINPGVEKLARFVNIYAGAGRRPAKARISVVLHGDATTVALADEAYARRMETQGNPNLPLLRQLREAGVELLVCGQAAAGLGVKKEEIAEEVGLAVSALTVNVNRQLNGFAYIPLQ